MYRKRDFCRSAVAASRLHKLLVANTLVQSKLKSCTKLDLGTERYRLNINFIFDPYVSIRRDNCCARLKRRSLRIDSIVWSKEQSIININSSDKKNGIITFISIAERFETIISLQFSISVQYRKKIL